MFGGVNDIGGMWPGWCGKVYGSGGGSQTGEVGRVYDFGKVARDVAGVVWLGKVGCNNRYGLRCMTYCFGL